MAGPRKASPDSAIKDALRGSRVLIVEGRYYEEIADALLAGAKRALDAAAAKYDIVTVPGALEIPQAISFACEAADEAGTPYDGALALGCVIRGETSHYDIVAGESARALMDLALGLGLPIGNGILTVDTEAQAFARGRPEEGDKGGAAVAAVLSLFALQRRMAGT